MASDKSVVPATTYCKICGIPRRSYEEAKSEDSAALPSPQPFVRRDRTGMARLDIDTPIEHKSWLTLILFVALGLIPWIVQCFAEVCDECMEEIDRRRGKS